MSRRVEESKSRKVEKSRSRRVAVLNVVLPGCAAKPHGSPGCSNGGRNNFPVSAGTGGKPGTSPIRSAESAGDLAGKTCLRHHAARQRGTMFKTRDESPRNPWLRHHAACQRGAVFKMLDAVMGATSGLEHGSTLASSVVAEDVAWRGDVWSGTWLHAGEQRGGRSPGSCFGHRCYGRARSHLTCRLFHFSTFPLSLLSAASRWCRPRGGSGSAFPAR
jgi:hypothetical protein